MAIQRLVRWRLALLALLLAIGAMLVVPQALAAPGQVVKEPAAGAVFTCGDATYTAVSGEVTFVFHLSEDAQGGVHVTGTIAPHNVRLLGSDGNTYVLGGAAWFGGNLNANGATEFTDTAYFRITGPGGVVGIVAAVNHITFLPDGTVTVEFMKDRSTCTLPEE